MKDSEQGASALPTGPSPSVEPVPVSPAGAASVPCAEELAARLADPAFQREQEAMILATSIGYQMRTVRLLRGLTVAELSAESGVGVATIKKIERGEWLEGIRILANIAHALDVALSVKMKPRTPFYERPEHVPPFEEDDASGIAARSDETLAAAQPEGQEPGPQGDARP